MNQGEKGASATMTCSASGLEHTDGVAQRIGHQRLASRRACQRNQSINQCHRTERKTSQILLNYGTLAALKIIALITQSPDGQTVGASSMGRVSVSGVKLCLTERQCTACQYECEIY